jgi:PST family polysaccharide transporter|tara:strand:- start:3323 stop:4591 length:1269 start_codon:yes stop_codon:yes gene_type:complete
LDLKTTTLWSALSTIIRMLAGIISVKFVAYIVGPSGVALIGQLQSFISITNSGANMGMGQGTIKYLSEDRKDKIKHQKIVSSSFFVTVFCSIIISTVILVFYNTIGNYLFKTNDFDFIIIILALSLSFYAVQQILTQALNGYQEIKKLIVAKIVTSIIGLIFTLLLVYIAGVEGALLALVITQIIGFIVLIYFSLKSSWFKKEMFFSGYDKETLKRLFKYSLMTFVSVILLNVRQIYLRDYVIENLSANAAGHWQAIWKISEIYLTVITFSLSIYYLPKLSSVNDKQTLKKEIFKGYKLLLPVVFVLSILMYLFRDLIILILFSKEFNPVRDLFLYQLIGDVLKIASWLLSFMMIAKAMTKEFLITEVVSISLFLILSLCFFNNYGILGLTYAYAINYAIYLIMMIVLFRKLLFKKHKPITV